MFVIVVMLASLLTLSAASQAIAQDATPAQRPLRPDAPGRARRRGR